jgi:hypothetical protein
MHLNLKVDFFKLREGPWAGRAGIHPLETACRTLPNGCRDCGIPLVTVGKKA